MEAARYAVHLESRDASFATAQVTKVAGRESIGALFDLTIDLLWTDAEGLDPSAIAGIEASLVVKDEAGEVRRFDGMIAEVRDWMDEVRLVATGAAAPSPEEAPRTYQLRLVPTAFRATLVETQEIYLGLSAPDIIKQKLAAVGLDEEDLEFRLAAKYPPIEFAVQYRETDLAFVQRLAEHRGIGIFFESKDGRDRMIFADHPGGYVARPGAERLPFSRDQERDVFSLRSTTRLVPAVYAVRDYNYRKPLLDLTASCEVPHGYAGGVVEYGTHHKEPAEGEAVARIRAEEAQVGQLVYEGRSDRATIAAGARVVVEGHPRRREVDLLVTEVEHEIAIGAVVARGAATRWAYANRFRGIPGDRPFRPARVTPKPRLAGVLGGIVEDAPGSDGTRANLDEAGRYVVRFLFDTVAPGTRPASRPVRMAQPHVGPDYGMHFPLKPGVEVLLAFVDGDPDRPIIVGAVPNAINPSPVDARTRTKNRLKSASGIVIELGDER